MSWITIVWSMNAGACLTLAAFYFAVWCKQREQWMYFLFSSSAIAAAAISAFELWMMNVRSVEEYQLLLRWIHVPVFVLVLSFVAFLRRYIHAGRAWLAWSIYGLRTLVLILNFSSPVSINFREITGVQQVPLLGRVVSVPVGVPNPWGFLSHVSVLLLLIFSVDATITLFRRGDRRRAWVVGTSIIFSTIFAFHVPLVIWGVLEIPFFLAFAYTAIVLAMGYELSNDMARAARIAHELELSENRLLLAAESARLGLWEWDLNSGEVWLTPNQRVEFGLPPSGKIRFEELMSRWHPDDRESVRQALKEAIEHGKEYHREFRTVLADGSVRWIAARGRVHCDERGRPQRLLGISVDITARKQAEAIAQQQRDELEQLRQQRTALLEQELTERTRLEREVIDICAREQQRIAYDLHDGVGQQLVGIALSAKLIEEQLRAERPAEAEKASAIVQLANQAARQARLTARTLEGADGVGDLRTALESLATSVSRNCSVKATITTDDSSSPISPPVAAQLYRIAQEAVHNAIEHGTAHEVQINLAFNYEVMVLTIQDDGKGFEPNASSDGMGLRIMRYRAQCIGGSCEVQSNRAEGTIVTCRVPLQAGAHVRPVP
jgi:PAS domain S-box-containing protein